MKKGELGAANEILDLGLAYNPRSPDLAYWKAKTLMADRADKQEILPFIDAVKANFNSRNTRAYTEQFFQLYWSDVEELEEMLALRD